MQDASETCLSARLAIYRDGEPEPKVEEVQGTGPQEVIHKLCTATSQVIRDLGGNLPQPAVRALIENLVHARFESATVSIMDGGRTIRVADRGPGIPDKHLALEPGYSSAGGPERVVIATASINSRRWVNPRTQSLREQASVKPISLVARNSERRRKMKRKLQLYGCSVMLTSFSLFTCLINCCLSVLIGKVTEICLKIFNLNCCVSKISHT